MMSSMRTIWLNINTLHPRTALSTARPTRNGKARNNHDTNESRKWSAIGQQLVRDGVTLHLSLTIVYVLYRDVDLRALILTKGKVKQLEEQVSV